MMRDAHEKRSLAEFTPTLRQGGATGIGQRPGDRRKGRSAMYPRFGMTYVAIQTARARARAAQQQQHDLAPAARAPVFSESANNDDVGVLWRMGAVIAVAVAVAGAIAWFAA